MVAGFSLPTLSTVVATAVVDSINPCAMGVLILLVSTLIMTRRKQYMLKIGMLYIGAVFLTYFAFGLGLIAFLSSIPQIISEYISITVGTIVVFAGLVEIKDYFWYGKGPSLAINAKYVSKIKEKMTRISLGTVVFLGIFVAAVELPCTGGPYLAITLLLSQQFNMISFFMLIVYNLIFVMPLIIILIMVMFGWKIQKIQNWKQTNKAYMRLATGILLIILGWLLILMANGTINLN
ncbi:MAG: GAP family protein [Nanoarchaeota archaeon]